MLHRAVCHMLHPLPVFLLSPQQSNVHNVGICITFLTSVLIFIQIFILQTLPHVVTLQIMDMEEIMVREHKKVMAANPDQVDNTFDISICFLSENQELDIAKSPENVSLQYSTPFIPEEEHFLGVQTAVLNSGITKTMTGVYTRDLILDKTNLKKPLDVNFPNVAVSIAHETGMLTFPNDSVQGKDF